MYVRAAVYAVRWNVRVASSGSTVRSCPSIPPTRAFTATRRLNWAALARSPRVTGRLTARCRVGSGKGQEELLQGLGVHRVGAVRVGQALLETAGDDGEAGPVEGAVHGGELGHDVLAVAALLDHPQHAAELALGAAQTVEDGGHLVRVELDHRSLLGFVVSQSKDTPWGMPYAGGQGPGPGATPGRTTHPMVTIIPIDTPTLGDRSYVAHDGEVALVVDPQRDIDRVLDVVHEAGVRITHVFETHIHNDYVTGGLALAKVTGAAYHVNGDDP